MQFNHRNLGRAPGGTLSELSIWCCLATVYEKHSGLISKLHTYRMDAKGAATAFEKDKQSLNTVLAAILVQCF